MKSGASTANRPACELEALLRTSVVLGQARGSVYYDPWEMQALRGEIRQIVRDDARLGQLFALRR